MREEIRRYLDEHGATYTPDALRSGLLSAGYDPDEVSRALDEWASERALAGGHGDRRSFGMWSLLIYGGALAAVFLVMVLLIRTDVGLATLGAGVLLIFLLIAWAISALIGRWVVPRMGFSVALAIPLVLAAGLGGTCLAIMSGMTPPRPTPGTVELRIEPPLQFSGSGAAACFVEVDGRSSSFSAENLGTLDGRAVRLDVYNFAVTSGPTDSAEPAAGPDTPSVYISLNPVSGSEPGINYSTIVSTRLAFDTAADGRSGTVTFEGLALEGTEEPGAAPAGSISGAIAWTCEPRR